MSREWSLNASRFVLYGPLLTLLFNGLVQNCKIAERVQQPITPHDLADARLVLFRGEYCLPGFIVGWTLAIGEWPVLFPFRRQNMFDR